MSKLYPGTEEYSRAVNSIGEINFSIYNFLNKFRKFRKDFNVTDNTLIKNLETVIEEIDSFIENERTNINSHEKTKINFDLEENAIKNMYICYACNEDLGSRFKDVQRHISLNNHKINSAKKYQKASSSTLSELSKSSPNVSSGNKIAMKENNFLLPIPKSTYQQQYLHQNGDNGKLTRQEKRKQKKEDRKEDRKEERNKRQRGTENDNLPKKARIFITSNFSQFLINSAETGNKLKCIPAYNEIIKSIQNSIHPVFPDAKFHLFGSRASGLGSIHSDLDIFLNIGNVFNLYGESSTTILKKLNTVRDLLSKNSEWKSFVSVLTARVPILKVANKKQQIDCDIAFSNGLGPLNTLLVKYFCELQPLCHKMCLFVKNWLLLTTLKVHFTTYTLSLMIIFYLQTKKILPPVRDLQREIVTPLMIGPWQGNIIEKTLKELKIEKCDDSYVSVRHHLYGFFEYYRSFSFSQYVVCPFLGVLIKKEIFNTVENPMKRYFEYYKQNRNENSFQLDRAMCVQDPFEQNHNVAKGISEGLLKLLRHYMNLTAKELK